MNKTISSIDFLFLKNNHGEICQSIHPIFKLVMIVKVGLDPNKVEIGSYVNSTIVSQAKPDILPGLS